ncbi:hypothetical protein PENTCL1PPCAC_18693, partial [Pristionchus entomophagus]
MSSGGPRRGLVGPAIAWSIGVQAGWRRRCAGSGRRAEECRPRRKRRHRSASCAEGLHSHARRSRSRRARSAPDGWGSTPTNHKRPVPSERPGRARERAVAYCGCGDDVSYPGIIDKSIGLRNYTTAIAIAIKKWRQE